MGSTDKPLIITGFILFFLFLIARLLSAFGITGTVILCWVLFISTLLVWVITFAFSIFKRKKVNVVMCLFLIIFTILIPAIRLTAVKFFTFRSYYDEVSMLTYKKVIHLPDTEFLLSPLSEENSWLGNVSYHKSDDGILIVFEEKYTLFDYYCYVRVFSDNSIDEMMPDVVSIEPLNNDWYYVNLF